MALRIRLIDATLIDATLMAFIFALEQGDRQPIYTFSFSATFNAGGIGIPIASASSLGGA
jgi:hypothetical protein